MPRSPLFHALAIAASLQAAHALADEGMWTFDHPPLQQVKQRYGLALTPAWLDRLRLSTVDFGATASFVSPNGLMLTNNHVAHHCLSQLSSAGRDLNRSGFLARQRSQELKCPNATAKVLESWQDVTRQVQDAAPASLPPEQQASRHKAVVAELEQRCSRDTGLKCEMVSLYNGAVYQLYRYREWKDVRLVFAPEEQASYFGGDADNFVYPRYALDMALLRVYQNGKPYRPAHYLTLSRQGVREGEPVFVAGHPGRTSRLETLAQLQLRRDLTLPLQLQDARMQQALLQRYAERSPEAARQANAVLFGIENWLKNMSGEALALQQPELEAAKRKEEAELKTAYAQAGLAGDPWREVDQAANYQRQHYAEYYLVDYGDTLLVLAGQLVEQAAERKLPESERLYGYSDGDLPGLERKLQADTPVYPQLDIARLTGQLQQMRDKLGADHPAVRILLGHDEPAQAARRLIAGSRLGQAAERRKLLAGAAAAIAASDDPLIAAARQLYPLRRQLERNYDAHVRAPLRQAASQLGQARFKLYGDALPPDATGTLRLSYGKVAGYRADGVAMPWKTVIGGLYARAAAFDHRSPFQLATALETHRGAINPDLPLDFVSTVDIVGGNSGSPVVNAQGELVGLIFDGNQQMLAGGHVYSDARARAIAVDSRGMLHLLDKAYHAGALLQELSGG
ncbi:S46 family peptidase [Chromobacterium paludis]|uniref:Dipeptidyl-peptidase n=1 Tax=Chromobacterium paludis TaxID=2605945 RepID=A0A5C1DLI2_9NEIS|nr:S46 family peptidase [Chromobacterium paludis]QEL57462.1 S46 family peptidase [Chromobacterium paludis]